MTYTWINLVFLAVAFTVGGFGWTRFARHRPRRWWVLVATTAILSVLTIVFDNLMIAIGLMTYSDTQTSGLTLGLMPVEDLSYTLAATVGVTGLWFLVDGGARPRPDRAETPGTGQRDPDCRLGNLDDPGGPEGTDGPDAAGGIR